ncbi:MAG: serine/threonine-protein phosphatase [Candidatus Competibacteraceae bacterium]|uniref:PP2C family protein-serine/threonine phosphatase n=1 Tax=Candidatus Contendibacter odensensis TaxID=1400860 RepID=UPI0012B68200|nr:protein phosphatase 2C domain-containing protein [Candidatus Contendobacter odensis]MBK8537075.1 serine/threonine-protein phosphatase [Candidatus Competibacteraceae bacterium]MBK8754426.1 serine/threonine-protein phosphatase [Candidatus Competibacteraceae bacterium]
MNPHQLPRDPSSNHLLLSCHAAEDATMTLHTLNLPHRWQWGGASQQGGRHEQQDRWAVFEPPGKSGLLAILADGMGGHVGGALGAQIVIDIAREFIQNPPAVLRTDPSAELERLCRRMHEAINRQSETARSTVVMVWIDRNQAHWLNIGDSRLYHFRDGQRLMRTRDHSAVQLLMDLGEINESEMATHPAQNRLYRSMGGDDAPKPDLGRVSIRPGDLLALCSDGIWEHVTESELWSATLASGPDAAARLLTEQATRRGGAAADNATLVLLRADSHDAGDSSGWLQRLSVGFASWFGR